MHTILYLSENDLINLDLSWEERFTLCRNALAAKARHHVQNPPKLGVHNESGAFIYAMPAYNATIPASGMKWVAGYPENKTRGLPMISGLLILNDPNTGLPVCIMGAEWLTNARTAAVSAISAERLARSDASVMGIIGAGAQARDHVQALPRVLPHVTTIKIYDLFPEVAAAFRKEMQPHLHAEIVIVPSAEEAVRNSDVVITAIPKPKDPIVKFEWLKEGVLCMPLETNHAWSNEALFGMDKFINDDYHQARLYQTQGAFSGGMPEFYAETGDIMAGLKPGRENDLEKIMVMNIGLGVVDVSVAHALHDKARNANIGTLLAL